jgi:hypothetical protein
MNLMASKKKGGKTLGVGLGLQEEGRETMGKVKGISFKEATV